VWQNLYIQRACRHNGGGAQGYGCQGRRRPCKSTAHHLPWKGSRARHIFSPQFPRCPSLRPVLLYSLKPNRTQNIMNSGACRCSKTLRYLASTKASSTAAPWCTSLGALLMPMVSLSVFIMPRRHTRTHTRVRNSNTPLGLISCPRALSFPPSPAQTTHFLWGHRELQWHNRHTCKPAAAAVPVPPPKVPN
jgi:hypothetical protein